MIGRLNLVLATVLVCGSLVGWFGLPESIPIHFDLAGRPDAWARRGILSWFGPPALALGLYGGMLLLARWVPRKPQWFNFPGKDRYLDLAPDERKPVDRALVAILHLSTTVVLVVFVVVQAMVYGQATGRSTTGLTVALLTVSVAGGPLVAAVGVVRVQRALDTAWKRHRAREGG